MVAGHLRQKGDIWYLVLSYIDENGVKRTPSKSTKLPVKGNKHKAEEMLLKWRLEVDEELQERILAKKSGKQYGELMDAWRNAQVPDAEIVDSSAEWGRKACEAIRDAESVDNVKARLTDAYTWLTDGYLTPEDYNKVEEYANQRLEKLNGNETAND